MTNLSTIYRYPIKACRGHAIEHAFVEFRGLQHDRRFLIVDPEGVAITQRDIATLALVVPQLADSTLSLSAPNMPDLILPVAFEGTERRVSVWETGDIKSIDQGDEVAEWFSSYLNTDARLVFMPVDGVRRVNPKYATRPDAEVSFADGYPILIASQESLDDLNARLETPLPMNRFRPNLVVKGCGPFEEDSWERIRIGEVELALVKPCSRCEVTTINQATLEKGKEPLKTMAKFRRVGGTQVMFGVNVIPLNEGKIRVGDDLKVL